MSRIPEKCRLGIRPITPGFGKFRIKFQPGAIGTARIKTPSVKGAIASLFDTTDPDYVIKTIENIPVNTTAEVYIPEENYYDTVIVDGNRVKAVRSGNCL